MYLKFIMGVCSGNDIIDDTDFANTPIYDNGRRLADGIEKWTINGTDIAMAGRSFSSDVHACDDKRGVRSRSH